MTPIRHERLVVGPLQTNCYVLWDSSTGGGVIIDPGGDNDLIQTLVKSLGVRVERILATHGHPDHIFSAGALSRVYGVGVAMHAADIPVLEESAAIAEMFYDMAAFVPFAPDTLLSDGELVPVGGTEARVIHTPGHSPGGVCFQTEAGVFCGDTLFAGSIGRTDLPGGSYEQLMESIRSALMSLEDSTPVFPGHGPRTTIGAERRSNPFLQ